MRGLLIIFTPAGGGCFVALLLFALFIPVLLWVVAYALTVALFALIPAIIFGVPIGLVRAWRNKDKTAMDYINDDVKFVFALSVVPAIIFVLGSLYMEAEGKARKVRETQQIAMQAKEAEKAREVEKEKLKRMVQSARNFMDPTILEEVMGTLSNMPALGIQDVVTAMHEAATVGDVEAMKRLKEQGTDAYVRFALYYHTYGYVGGTGSGGATPMVEAAKGGHVEAMKWLKEQGVDIQKGLMYEAARGGHVEAMKWLKEQGADINESSIGGSPIYIASQGGHNEAVKWLKEQGAVLDNTGTGMGSMGMPASILVGGSPGTPGQYMPILEAPQPTPMEKQLDFFDKLRGKEYRGATFVFGPIRNDKVDVVFEGYTNDTKDTISGTISFIGNRGVPLKRSFLIKVDTNNVRPYPDYPVRGAIDNRNLPFETLEDLIKIEFPRGRPNQNDRNYLSAAFDLISNHRYIFIRVPDAGEMEFYTGTRDTSKQPENLIRINLPRLSTMQSTQPGQRGGLSQQPAGQYTPYPSSSNYPSSPPGSPSSSYPTSPAREPARSRTYPGYDSW